MSNENSSTLAENLQRRFYPLLYSHGYAEDTFLRGAKLLTPSVQGSANLLLSFWGCGVLGYQLVHRLPVCLGLPHVGVEELQRLAVQAILFAQRLHQPLQRVLAAALPADRHGGEGHQAVFLPAQLQYPVHIVER